MVKTTLSQRVINTLLHGKSRNPFHILGMHKIRRKDSKEEIVVRAVLPDIEQAFVYDCKQQKTYPMTRVSQHGLFEAIFSRRRTFFPYQLETLDSEGNARRFADAYSFPPLLSEEDLKLFDTGRHYAIYDQLGCHPMEFDGVSGALFAVWAPHAVRVSVIGDFNTWSGTTHLMRLWKKWGVWEIFIPGVNIGERYQYEILTQSGAMYRKADPYGIYFEQPPRNTSIVTDLTHFSWTDQDWIRRREQNDPLRCPISTYEVHPGSWLKKTEAAESFLSYRELAEELIPYVKKMGFTHIELLPVAEHPFYGSWGYQVTGYYAPTSRYGSPEDFRFFINECHRQGIGVIIDWVPAHFPKDEFSLCCFDGTSLYEHADPQLGEHKDWGTLVFDYGRNEVRNFLIANAIFWFEKYHIDGIRVDAVASMLYLDYSRQEGEWTPNKYGGRENLDAIDFLKELNTVLHEKFPGTMTFAEESTSWLGVTYPSYLGGLGFTFKWNLGWMNDMLHYLSHDPVYRKFVHTMVPFALLYAFHEHFMLELSHDEVVYGKGSLLAKMPGDEWQKFANLRLLFGFMFGHPGKKLLFMGNEFGVWREWDHDSSLEWGLLQYGLHQGIQQFVRDCNRLYTAEPALYMNDIDEWGFRWIDYHDFERSIFSFIRKGWDNEERFVICLYNFTPVPRNDYRLGVPFPGYYRELINSDDAQYGGSDIRNPNGCYAESIPWHQQPYSINISLPPLGMIVFKPMKETTIEDRQRLDLPGEQSAAERYWEKIRHQTPLPAQTEHISANTRSGQTAAVSEEIVGDEKEERTEELFPGGESAEIPERPVIAPASYQIAKPQGSKSRITQTDEAVTRRSSG